MMSRRDRAGLHCLMQLTSISTLCFARAYRSFGGCFIVSLSELQSSSTMGFIGVSYSSNGVFLTGFCQMQMMGEQFKDENMVQTPKEVAAVVVRVMEDYPKPHFRYQTSDFVKRAASDRWKDPTGYSMVHKYGRSTFSSQDVLP